MRKPSEYMDPATLEIINEFLLTRKNNRTKTEYFSYLNLLCDFCKKDLLCIGYDDAASYFEHLKMQHRNGDLAYETICVRLSCCKTFARFIAQNHPDMDYKDPFLRILLPAMEPRINPRRIPSLSELDSVLSTARGMSPMYYVILILAFRIGLTASNIVSITINRIFVENNTMFLIIPAQDNTKNDLYIKIPSDVQTLLTNYISKLPYMDQAGHIFYNKWKNPLTIKNMDSIVKQIVKISDVLEEYTIKDLRSRAILDMVNAGAEPSNIASYTRLSNLRINHFCNAVGIVGECPAELTNLRILA